jgi:hypothetical protein
MDASQMLSSQTNTEASNTNVSQRSEEGVWGTSQLPQSGGLLFAVLADSRHSTVELLWRWKRNRLSHGNRQHVGQPHHTDMGRGNITGNPCL